MTNDKSKKSMKLCELDGFIVLILGNGSYARVTVKISNSSLIKKILHPKIKWFYRGGRAEIDIMIQPDRQGNTINFMIV